MEQDLKTTNTRFKWAIQHFHILNKGTDVQDNLCQPHFGPDGTISYPDDHGGLLMKLFGRNGVNAVSFGHSHVYERYFTGGTHYIEAARISAICYRGPEELPHPSGLLPVFENNSKRSFLIVERKDEGLFASAFFAEGELQIFDEYQIADNSGYSIVPLNVSSNI